MPLPHPRPPYETLGNGGGSPHLCYPLGFAQTSQETRAFSMLRNYLIPWNVLWIVAGPKPNALAPFKGSEEVAPTQPRLPSITVLEKQLWECWEFLISHAFVQIKLFSLGDSQTAGDWRQATWGWISKLLFTCGHVCSGGNHSESVSSLGSLRPLWKFRWWCGSNFITCSEWKKAFS